jgi:hypothetical protein
VIRARTSSDFTLGTVVVDQLAELLAILNPLRRGRAVLVRVHVHRVLPLGHGLAQVVEAAVAGDPVQPRPHVEVPLVSEDRVVSGDEDLLEDVLGVLSRGKHVLAEREQARVVALEQHLERALVPIAHHRDQAVVLLQAQQPRGPREQPAPTCVC